ncbi:hypothetical protein CALCODRAFT_88928 [Calocera cornea HHB12733]|uniref:Defective in cullin neddylation protein n=1 Tax=Calocera cornea HHB12733 TaxID=1353952 RepID=A0A165DBG7_9BASI|nr:hypothetical protein CALCODRAFT_88928 [Calocera cornea HHB12733]
MPAKRKRAADGGDAQESGGRTTRSTAKARAASVEQVAPEPKKRATRSRKEPVREPSPEQPTRKRSRRGSREKPIELSNGEGMAMQPKKGKSRKPVLEEIEEIVALEPVAAAPAKAGKKSKTNCAEDVETEDENASRVNGASATNSASEKVRPSPPPCLPSSPATQAFPPYSTSRLSTLYSTYADPSDHSLIPTSGLVQLCEDASMPMDGVLPVLLAWQLGARRMGVFEQEEFVKGLGVLSQDQPRYDRPGGDPVRPASPQTRQTRSIQPRVVRPLRARPPRRQQAGARLSVRLCQRVHLFLLFPCRVLYPERAHILTSRLWCREQRLVEIETGLALLSITLARRFPLGAELCEYMQERAGAGAVKGLTKDHWSMVFDFCTTVDEELEGYDEDEAWPTLIDEFVLWKKARAVAIP